MTLLLVDNCHGKGRVQSFFYIWVYPTKAKDKNATKTQNPGGFKKKESHPHHHPAKHSLCLVYQRIQKSKL